MGSLLAAFVGFLLASPWTAVPLGTFLIATGYGWARHQALVARAVTFAMTTVTLVTLGLIVVFIFAESIPAFQYETASVFGVCSGTRDVYTGPLGRRLGARSLLAAPDDPWDGDGDHHRDACGGPARRRRGAVHRRDRPAAGSRARQAGDRGVGGHPSIVYGFIGFTVINPWAGGAFALNGGSTYLFVGIVVGLMALPTVVSVAEDALTSVPSVMKDGSLALGATDWQSMTSITLPAAFSGVSAAVLLGCRTDAPSVRR